MTSFDPDTALDTVDLAVLSRLRTIGDTVDPPPQDLAARTKLALTIASLHAELARIVATPAAAVRGSDPVDSVSFSAGSASLLIRVATPGAERLTLDGWVSPGGATVEVHCHDITLTVTATDTGRLVFEEVSAGPLWFVIWPDGPGGEGKPVVTPVVEW